LCDEPKAFFGNSKPLLPYLNPSRTILFEDDPEHPRAFNVFANGSAQGIIDSTAAAYPSDISTARLNRLLNMSCQAMLETKGTLYSLYYLFTSEKYRAKIIRQVKHPDVRYALQKFHDMKKKDQDALSESLINRLDPLIAKYRTIIGQTKGLRASTLLVDLPEGETPTYLAALVMSTFPGKLFIERPHVAVGEGEKFIACSYLGQLPKKLRQKMVGEANLVSFRVGVEDAKELTPAFDIRDQDFSLTELPFRTAYVRLGVTHQADLEPLEFHGKPENSKKIRNRSRSQHSSKRKDVEKKLAQFVANL